MDPLNSLNSLNDFFTEAQEPKLREYPLMSFYSQLYLASFYVLFVKIVGPYLMKNRPAFTLRNALILYNFFQVVSNVYLFNELGKVTYFRRYSFWCQPEEDPADPFMDKVMKCIWMMFISKWTDCFDTIFFVLRKKNKQISMLHLIHHGAMPPLTWFAITFILGGHCTFGFLLNMFVHIIMYSYYMLSAFGPQMQRILNPYKKYLTILQIVQFVLVITQNSVGLLNGCPYPKWAMYYQIVNTSVFLVLFCNFYKKTYMKNEIGKKK